jgi:hypothetical protein
MQLDVSSRLASTEDGNVMFVEPDPVPKRHFGSGFFERAGAPHDCRSAEVFSVEGSCLPNSTGSVAAIADKDAFACATSFSSVKNRAGTEASFLHPADCDDRMSDEAVSLVHVQGERDVFSTIAK